MIREVHRYAVAVVLSSSASGAWCCPSRASAQRRRETKPYRHPLPGLTESSAPSKRAVQNGPIRPTAQRLPSPRRRGPPPLRQSTGTEGGPRGSIRPERATWNRCSGRTACESGPFGPPGVRVPAGEGPRQVRDGNPVVGQHVHRPGHRSSTTWTTLFATPRK